MFCSVITTIQEPTLSVHTLVEQLTKVGGRLIVAGDSKGPATFVGRPGEPWPVDFLSLAQQECGQYHLAQKLPTKHYARKNIAYLAAIRMGATCLYETDDDNAPNGNWTLREMDVREARVVEQAPSRWINAYRYFSDEHIWPRGLPLDEILKPVPATTGEIGPLVAPIQQGLVNGSPDVDAIWRLVLDRPFTFREDQSLYLEPGNWCPFNTQSTWWWPIAYPLLYIPSYCSFRMCDIWKSFIAQRCLWAMGLGVCFHAAEVDQDRNYHDLMRDFRDEIPGYDRNRELCQYLEALDLSPEPEAVSENLRICYRSLIQHDIFPPEELELVDLWLKDLDALG